MTMPVTGPQWRPTCRPALRHARAHTRARRRTHAHAQAQANKRTHWSSTHAQLLALTHKRTHARTNAHMLIYRCPDGLYTRIYIYIYIYIYSRLIRSKRTLDPRRARRRRNADSPKIANTRRIYGRAQAPVGRGGGVPPIRRKSQTLAEYTGGHKRRWPARHVRCTVQGQVCRTTSRAVVIGPPFPLPAEN